MSRLTICSIFCLALIVSANGNPFRKIEFNNGRISFPRNLQQSSNLINLESEHGRLGAVKAEFSQAFRDDHSLKTENRTDVFIYISTSETGFCTSCTSGFHYFKCNPPYCERTTTDKSWMTYASRVTGADTAKTDLSLVVGETTLWKLATPALLFSSQSLVTIYFGDATSTIYYDQKNTYGFIGLGVSGEAAKNFPTESPIFSVKITGAGQGSIIFGKDTSLIDSKRTPIVYTSSDDWSLKAKNFTIGVFNKTDINTEVVFDLHLDGIGIPKDVFFFDDPSGTGFFGTYNLKHNNSIGYPHFHYEGNLKDLPNLLFTLEDDNVLAIPPEVYMKELSPGFYIPIFREINTHIVNSKNYLVLGWPVLSSYYTVFEKKAGSTAQITLNPVYPVASNGILSGNTLYYIIGIAAFLLVIVGLAVLKGKGAAASAANPAKAPSTGLELR